MNSLDMDFRLSEIERQLSNLRGKLQSDLNPLLEYYVDDVREIVPTLHMGGSARTLSVPADRYYAALGACTTSQNLPEWMAAGSGSVTYANWDATDLRAYLTVESSGTIGGPLSFPAFIYPTGPFGTATSYAPKNTTAAAVTIQFRARFPANADYTVYGMGAASLSDFSTAASNHFIQVLRNSANWELGTCDGTTISQTASSGGADGSLHDFKVRWIAGEVTLYVDGVLVITKSTNIPTRPLGPLGLTITNVFDIVDYLVEWEV